MTGDGEPAPDPAEIDRALEVLRRVRPVELQWRGWDLRPHDYYSPINDQDFLWNNRDLWHDRGLPRGVELRLEEQLEYVRRLARHAHELGDVPDTAAPGPPAFHWHNDFWRGFDALVHYGLMRECKPRRVVEIGTGWSSLLLARALAANAAEGAGAVVDQVEPYPREEIMAVVPKDWTLHQSPLQRASLGIFEALGDGDVCFYDGSHVTRTASDVNWFFFEVVPRLAPGVLVHIHDIFWPEDYPDAWIFERHKSWNEQYLLQAFLMYNSDFQVLIANRALQVTQPAAMAEAFAGVNQSGGSVSVWMRRRA